MRWHSPAAASTVPPTRKPPEVGVTMKARAGQMMEWRIDTPGAMIWVL